jgi:predicted amino acid-binding ACT domain protein
VCFGLNESFIGKEGFMTDETKPKTESKELSGTELLSFIKEVSGHAEREVSRVSMMYKIVAGCLTLIVAVGIGFTYKDASEFRNNARDEVKNIHDDISEQKKLIKENMEHQEQQMRGRQETLFIEMQSHLSNNVASLGQEVKNKVAEQFKTDNINNLVHEKARERVDTIATPIINEKISKQLQPAIDEVGTNVVQIKKDIVDSRSTLQGLQKDAEFINIILSAQNDNRGSFDKLRKLAEDEKYYRRVDAYNAYTSIANAFDQSPELEYHMHWRDGQDPAKLDISGIAERYKKTWLCDERAAILQYIWKRDNFSKKQKLEFMVGVMSNDPSLKVVVVASRQFMTESNQRYRPLPIDSMLEWWENNKEKMNDKPVDKK